MGVVLETNNLTVTYNNGFTLHPLSTTIAEGEIVAVVGESGSGKTTLAKALLNLLGSSAQVSGTVKINGHNIFQLPAKELAKRRSLEFAICLQNSYELLNPLLTVREQICEVLRKAYRENELGERLAWLINQVDLDSAVLTKYPHQLSGGMLQKINIICAVALQPGLVILDEPTSSLDRSSREEVLAFIRLLNRQAKMSFLIVTHDLSIAKAVSERIYILYGGKLVEVGLTDEVLAKPRHPYTMGLINSSMEIHPFRDIWGIRQVEETAEQQGCPFYPRCTQSLPLCATTMPELLPYKQEERLVACNRGGVVTILQGRNISKSYGKEQIINNLNLEIYAAEVVSLVGKSGIGKTTLSQILAGYLFYDTGEILFDGKPADFRKLHRMKGGLQMVFQDPHSAINPHLSVQEAVQEPLEVIFKKQDPTLIQKALGDVGLPRTITFLRKKVKHLSGGQKQRLAIARALVMEPRLLIADEPTSMLDASSKANMLRLLKSLQNEHGFSMLMVTHDLSSAVKISNRIYLLENKDELREITDTKEIAPFFC
ncbi:MAG: ABC transporter ATP-binding protein [Firmicutes bacterium]|nr:ABC transporter ATP-binding protein [Bacillota bacterium]